MYRFRLNKKVIGESCKGIALAVKRSPTDNIQLQRVVGGFLAGWLFFSSALMAVERRGGGVGWRGGETGRGRAEAEAVAGCRGSGRYLVNDYSLARRRCQAWNTRSCLRCSACCCCRPCYPGSGCGAWTQFRPAPYLSRVYGECWPWLMGWYCTACPCNCGCKQAVSAT